MKYLIDKSPKILKEKIRSSFVVGQLLTPLTAYSHWGGIYAIDNGAFSEFREDKHKRLIKRQKNKRSSCLFVTCPDIVGSGRRTLELFKYRNRWIPLEWPIAFVAQDGSEDLPIPWEKIKAIFIGGKDPWKDSQASADIVKTAKILGVHVHVGRVNTPKRFIHFHELGADTCDGSGIAKYDHMLEKIEKALTAEQHELFDLKTKKPKNNERDRKNNRPIGRARNRPGRHRK